MLLELGGKAPLVVLDDADLDAAVDAAAFGAFMNQGQICMSTERIVVDDEGRRRVRRGSSRRRPRRLPAGDPREGKTLLGSRGGRSTPQRRIGQLIEDAVAKGAELVGRRPGRRHA